MKLSRMAMLCPLILASCSAMTGGAEIAANAACTVWPYTDYSKNDTARTKSGNQFNNTSRDGFCGNVQPRSAQGRS
jgi:hypothetical protein